MSNFKNIKSKIYSLSDLKVQSAIAKGIGNTFATKYNRGEINKHKKIVKWTFPIWMYVAITGVMVYLFMVPYY